MCLSGLIINELYIYNTYTGPTVMLCDMPRILLSWTHTRILLSWTHTRILLSWTHTRILLSWTHTAIETTTFKNVLGCLFLFAG